MLFEQVLKLQVDGTLAAVPKFQMGEVRPEAGQLLGQGRNLRTQCNDIIRRSDHYLQPAEILTSPARPARSSPACHNG